MRARLIACVLAMMLEGAACGSPGGITLPRNDDAQSALAIVRRSGEAPALYALAPPWDTHAIITKDGDSRISVLFLPWSLEALQLDQGLVNAPPAGTPSRALPAFNALYAASIANGSFSGWRKIDALDPDEASLELPALNVVACLNKKLVCPRISGDVCPLACDGAPAIAAPMLPAPPAHVSRNCPDAAHECPCPEGWSLEQRAGDSYCLAPATLECDPGYVQLPGTSTCAIEGGACPSGNWPTDLPATGVLYVQAGLSTDGDGTIDNPFASLARAMIEAPRLGASLIALSRGSFTTTTALIRGLSIAGVCEQATEIHPDSSTNRVAILAMGDNRVTGVTVRGGIDRTILANAGVLMLDRVVVDGTASGSAIGVVGELDAKHIVTKGEVGIAIFGGTLIIEDSVIAGSAVALDLRPAVAGICAYSKAEIHRCTIRVVPVPSIYHAITSSCGTISIDSSTIDVMAGGAELLTTSATLTDVVLRADTIDTLFAVDNGWLRLERTRVEGGSIGGGSTYFRLEDVVFASSAFGIFDSGVKSSRVLMLGNGPFEALALNVIPNLDVEIADLAIEGPEHSANDGPTVFAVTVDGKIDRVRIKSDGHTLLGQVASTSSISLHDVALEQTTSTAPITGQSVLEIQGGIVTGERIELIGGIRTGAVIAGCDHISLRDLSVYGASESGVSLVAPGPTSCALSVDRAVISNVGSHGLEVGDAGNTLKAHDLVISRSGSGVSVIGARADVSSFSIEDASKSGIEMVATNRPVTDVPSTFSNGIVLRCAVGITETLSARGTFTDVILSGVEFRDNKGDNVADTKSGP